MSAFSGVKFPDGAARCVAPAPAPWPFMAAAWWPPPLGAAGVAGWAWSMATGLPMSSASSCSTSSCRMMAMRCPRLCKSGSARGLGRCGAVQAGSGAHLASAPLPRSLTKNWPMRAMLPCLSSPSSTCWFSEVESIPCIEFCPSEMLMLRARRGRGDAGIRGRLAKRPQRRTGNASAHCSCCRGDGGRESAIAGCATLASASPPRKAGVPQPTTVRTCTTPSTPPECPSVP